MDGLLCVGRAEGLSFIQRSLFCDLCLTNQNKKLSKIDYFEAQYCCFIILCSRIDRYIFIFLLLIYEKLFNISISLDYYITVKKRKYMYIIHSLFSRFLLNQIWTYYLFQKHCKPFVGVFNYIRIFLKIGIKKCNKMLFKAWLVDLK